MTDYLARFRSYHELTGLSVCLLDGTGAVEKLFPEFDTLPFSEYWIGCCLLDFQLQKRDMDHPLVFCMEDGFYLGMCQLDENRYMILGPATPFSLTREWVRQLCSKYVHPQQMDDYCSKLIHTPVYPYHKFTVALATAIFLYQGKHIDPGNIFLCNTAFRDFPDLENDLGKALFQHREDSAYHSAMDHEAEILEAIRRGDREDLKTKLITLSKDDGSNLSRNRETHLRYRSAIFIALAARAAIRGGLLSETALSLCDLYCQQLESISRSADMEAYIDSVVMDFCQRVFDRKSSVCRSPAMQKCRQYITANLHKPIRAADIAAFAGISVRHLTTLFRQELGLSLREYINREKITEAKYLLDHSGFSLTEISYYLGYNSQSYFTQVFRQLCGQTPNEYRSRNRN